MPGPEAHGPECSMLWSLQLIYHDTGQSSSPRRGNGLVDAQAVLWSGAFISPYELEILSSLGQRYGVGSLL